MAFKKFTYLTLLLFLSQPFNAQINDVILLDGFIDHITIPDNNSLDISDNLTIEAWVFPCHFDHHQIIFNKNWCFGQDFSFNFEIRQGGFLEFTWTKEGDCADYTMVLAQNAEFEPQTWTHVAAVHTLNSVTLFVNGNPIPTTIMGQHGSIHLSNAPIRIGTYLNASSNYQSYFDGQIDEVRFWNKALSENDIQSRFNIPLTGNEDGLLIYFDMENIAGTGNNNTIPNLSNLTGSLNNGTTQGTNITPFTINSDISLNELNLGDDYSFCGEFDPITLDVSNTGLTFLWQDGSTTPIYTINQAGTYWVETSIGNCTKSDTITILADNLQINLGNDTTLCANQPLILDATYPNATYQWQNGSTNASIIVEQSGEYWVEIQVGDCTVADTISVDFIDVPQVELGNDTILCIGESLLLDVTNTNTTYQWQNGSTQSVFLVENEGIYAVTVTNGTCSAQDFIIVDFDFPEANLGPDSTFCVGDNVLLQNTGSLGTYLWQDGSIASTFSPSLTGLYWLEVQIGNCIDRDSIFLIFEETPTINLGNDTTLCEGASIILEATYPNATYLWQDGSTQNIFTSSSPGLFSVATTLGNCTATDEILINYSFPIADLGADLSLCEGTEASLTNMGSLGNFLWSDSSSQNNLTTSSSGIYWLEVELNGCLDRDSIFVDFSTFPVINLGNDTVICQDYRPILNATFEAATYLWQNGSTSPTLTVTEPGTYSVQVTNGACSAIDSIHFKILSCLPCNIFIPNVFSPNGDGANDQFVIFGNAAVVEIINLKIFDRWGALIFENRHFSPNDFKNAWDGSFRGEKMNPAVFTYFAEIACEDGPVQFLKGDITLLR